MNVTRFAFALILTASIPTAARAQVWEVRNQFFTLAAGPTEDAYFGWRLAQGDFDGDGRTDLAVAARDVDTVEVYRGTADGLASTKWVTLTGTASTYFGTSLAAGDFDHDGRDELAVGTVLADVATPAVIADAGRVDVYGFNGSFWTSESVLTQATSGVPGSPEADDHFGYALAVGNFDGDDYDDLAVGIPDEAVGEVFQAGAVNVFYGGSGGLSGTGAQLFYRGGGGITGSAEYFALLGLTLAAGDFDANGSDDLAVSVVTQTVAGHSETGAVVVLYGQSSTGLGLGQLEIDPVDLGGVAEGQLFGSSLLAADFDRDAACVAAGNCADDLVIGAPDETADDGGFDVSSAGRVYVVFGSWANDGLDLATADAIDQGTLFGQFGSEPEPGDNFGSALAAGNFDGKLGDELVIGAEFEEFDGIGLTGCAHLLFGGTDDLDGSVYQFLWSSAGYRSAPAQFNDHFAKDLAAGDFDGNGTADLAIGIYARSFGADENAGAVQVLYGALFADGFESAQPASWSNF